MKKLMLFTLLSILLAGCAAPLKLISYKEESLCYDFTTYSSKGFLFTPEKFNGDYESVGIIKLQVYPEMRYLSIQKDSDDFKSKWITTKQVSSEDAIKLLYEKATAMGANALTNFKIEMLPENYSFIVNPTVRFGYKISGFSIKRK